MRKFPELGVLASLSAGPRDDLHTYINRTYPFSREIVRLAARRLVDEEYITQEKRRLTASGRYTHTLTDEGRCLGNTEFTALGEWLEKLAHVTVPTEVRGLDDNHRNSQKVPQVTPMPSEWRLLMVLLRQKRGFAGELAEKAQTTRTVVQNCAKAELIKVIRREHSDAGRPAGVYAYTEAGEARGLACLALGRQLHAEWMAGSPPQPHPERQLLATTVAIESPHPALPMTPLQ